MKLINIVEARSNPARNPKQNAYNELSKYAGRKDIFVTFSSVNKVGIFPKTMHKTPIGFYAYPIDFILKNLQTKTLENSRPYPGQDPSKNALITQIVDYTGIYDVTNTIPSDVMQLIHTNEFFKDIENFDKLQTFSQLYNLMYDISKSSIVYDWATVGHPKITNVETGYRPYKMSLDSSASKDANIQVTKVFRQLGINGLTDLMGTSTIHENEPTQAVFFTMRNLKHIDTLLDKNDLVSIEPYPIQITNNTTVDEIIDMLKFVKKRDSGQNYLSSTNYVLLKQWVLANFPKDGVWNSDIWRYFDNHNRCNSIVLYEAIESIKNLDDQQLTELLTKVINKSRFGGLFAILFRHYSASREDITIDNIPNLIKEIRQFKHKMHKPVRKAFKS